MTVVYCVKSNIADMFCEKTLFLTKRYVAVLPCMFCIHTSVVAPLLRMSVYEFNVELQFTDLVAVIQRPGVLGVLGSLGLQLGPSRLADPAHQEGRVHQLIKSKYN